MFCPAGCCNTDHIHLRAGWSAVDLPRGNLASRGGGKGEALLFQEYVFI